MGITWSSVSICVLASSTKFSSAGFQDSALSMLSTHACGAQRRKGACAPLGLVVHENMIQGNGSKNCIALTRVTRVYCFHHSWESVLRPVLVFLQEGTDCVSRDTEGHLCCITPALSRAAPKSSPVDRDLLSCLWHLHQACREYIRTTVLHFNKMVEIHWGWQHRERMRLRSLSVVLFEWQ